MIQTALKQNNKNAFLILILLLAYVFSLFSHLNILPLSFEEPRRGIVALEMMITQNYAVPRINGELYLNKPPVYNWLLISLFNITGSYAEWIIRLPTVLSLLLIGLINFFVVKKYVNISTAIYGSLFFITSADIVFYFSNYGEIDMFYSLIVYIQVLSIYYFYQKKNYWMLFIISYFLTGIGLLTKGLPSIAFQGITLLAAAIAVGKFKKLLSLPHFTGILVLAGILFGYFSWYGEFADPMPYIAKLFSESAQRTAIEKSFLQSISHLFTFPLMLLKLLLPWAFLLIFYFKNRNFRAVLQNPFVAFSLLFFISNIIIYWLSPGTRDRYLYMFLPFLFNIIAFGYVEFCSSNKKYTRYLRIFFTIIVSLIAIIFFLLPVIPFKYDIEEAWLKGVVFGILFSGIAYLFIRIPNQWILWVFLSVTVARYSFNFIVIPERRQSIENKKPIKWEVNKIIEEFTYKDKIYLNAPFEEVSLEMVVPGILNYKADFDQLEWPDFSLSYYISKKNFRILEHTDTVMKNKWYITEKKYLPESGINIYYDFYIKNRDITYVLYKYE